MTFLRFLRVYVWDDTGVNKTLNREKPGLRLIFFMLMLISNQNILAMKIVRKSHYSGIERELDLPVTQEQLAAWKAGKHAQYAFPDLSADQREFIISGTTQEEWDEMFPKTDE